MTQKATLHPPRVESDSDSDDAPEEFSSSLPQELSSTLVSSSGRSLSPKLVSTSNDSEKRFEDGFEGEFGIEGGFAGDGRNVVVSIV